MQIPQKQHFFYPIRYSILTRTPKSVQSTLVYGTHLLRGSTRMTVCLFVVYASGSQLQKYYKSWNVEVDRTHSIFIYTFLKGINSSNGCEDSSPPQRFQFVAAILSLPQSFWVCQTQMSPPQPFDELSMPF